MKLKYFLVTVLLVGYIFSMSVYSSNNSVYCRHENSGKKIALTFDDGPHYRYTAEILDILHENNIKATFFVIGENAVRYPELVKREVSEGHEIANHTFTHPHVTESALEDIPGEITMTEDTIYEIAEVRTKLFRPPEGICSDKLVEIAERLDYNIILWDIDTEDWRHPSVDEIVKNVTSNVHSGAIVLFHDFIGGKNSPTPEALRIIIPKLKEEGYSFVTVSELIMSD